MITFEKIEVVNRLRKNLAFETIKNYTVSYDNTWIFSKIQYTDSYLATKSTSSAQVIPCRKCSSITSISSTKASKRRCKPDASNGLQESKLSRCG